MNSEDRRAWRDLVAGLEDELQGAEERALQDLSGYPLPPPLDEGPSPVVPSTPNTPSVEDLTDEDRRLPGTDLDGGYALPVPDGGAVFAVSRGYLVLGISAEIGYVLGLVERLRSLPTTDAPMGAVDELLDFLKTLFEPIVLLGGANGGETGDSP